MRLSKHRFFTSRTLPYFPVLSSTQPTNVADPKLKKQPKTSSSPHHFLICCSTTAKRSIARTSSLCYNEISSSKRGSIKKLRKQARVIYSCEPVFGFPLKGAGITSLSSNAYALTLLLSALV